MSDNFVDMVKRDFWTEYLSLDSANKLDLPPQPRVFIGDYEDFIVTGRENRWNRVEIIRVSSLDLLEQMILYWGELKQEDVFFGDSSRRSDMREVVLEFCRRFPHITWQGGSNE